MNAAVYPASRSYYQKVLPAVKSLLYHSKVEQVVLLIEDDEYPGYLPEPVITMNAQKVFSPYLAPNGPNVTRAPHAYLSIARTIYAGPLWTMGYRRILSLDADTIVAQDIGDEPWTMDLDGCHVAGVPEVKLSAECHPPAQTARKDAPHDEHGPVPVAGAGLHQRTLPDQTTGSGMEHQPVYLWG